MSVFHYQQFDISQQYAAMKVGTDSDLLGTLSAGGNRILDVGTGTGVLSLMLAQRFPDARITAIEIDAEAVKDAETNFRMSKFSERISLQHISFQDYLDTLSAESELFDSVVCNPPYFDKSLECPDEGRTRARHSSSLPFNVLAQGAFRLLQPGGVFSVCIPPEVLQPFSAECLFAGFSLKTIYRIQTHPDKPARRLVLVHQKGNVAAAESFTYCMRNADHTRSDWYLALMKDFLVNPSPR